MTPTLRCQSSTYSSRGTTMLLALLLSAPSLASEITVAPDGNGDHNTIQGAIDAASDGDVIIVAPGTYTGEGESVIDFLGKAITVRSSGGAEETFIDGEDLRRGVTFENDESDTSVLDGFTIQNGFANNGGGLYSYSGTSPKVTNCTIQENRAERGGGMYSVGGVTCDHCEFSGNEANSDGGGFYDLAVGSTLTNCTIEANQASQHGGGMYSTTNTESQYNTFTSNVANLRGGAVYLLKDVAMFTECTFISNAALGHKNSDPDDNEGHGGGGGIHNYKGHPVLNCCVFENNRAFDGVGGGMSNKGVKDGDRAAPALTNCTFSANQAIDGGGIYNGSFSSPELDECTVTGNIAGGFMVEGIGGGIYNQESTSDASLTDTQVCGNSPNQIEGAWSDLRGNWVNLECPEDCPVDLSGDGTVNGADLTILLAAWGPAGACAPADINGDGEVNGADLTLVLSEWGACL